MSSAGLRVSATFPAKGATRAPASVLAAAPKLDPNTAALWKEAVALYADETKDFIWTLDENREFLREHRAHVLTEKFDKRINEIEITLSKSNREVIAEIEKHVAKFGMESLDDSLLMRMSQLYYERANFDLNEKMRQYEKAVHAYQAGQRKNLPPLPEPDYLKTISYSQNLINHFPLSPLADRAQYVLGYCLFDIGEENKAANLYEQMLRTHPHSPLAEEVRWRLAEHYFDQNQYLQAANIYRKLASYANPFQMKAIYKLGATYYAQGSYAEAGSLFIKLFYESQHRREIPLDDRRTFEEESLDYLAYIKAKKINLKTDELTDSLVTEALAKAYARAQDDESARQAYLSFVQKAPLSSYSPRFMDRVVSSYEETDEPGKAQRVRLRLLGGLGRKSLWWARHKSETIATVEAEDIYEYSLLQSALFFGRKALDSKKSDDYMKAIQFYKTFLSEYPGSELAHQAKFELADQEYYSGRYKDASAHYLEAVVDPVSSEFKEEAAYGHVLASAKMVGFSLTEKSGLKPARNAQGLLAEPSNPTEKEKVFLRAAQQYVNNVDSGERRQKVMYKAAEVLFQHNQFEKTRAVLDASIDETMPNSITLKSLRLVAETYDLQNNWEKVAETNRRLLSMADTAGDTDSVSASMRPGARALNTALKKERAGDLEGAARDYEQFALAFQRSPDAPIALWKAAELNRRFGRISFSNKFADQLIKEYSHHALASKAQFLRAQNDESLIEFESAAVRFERFAKERPEDLLSREALFNAASIRRDMMANREAAHDFEEFVKRAQSDENQIDLAGYYQRAGQNEKAAAIYRKFASGRFGPDFQIKSLFEIGRMKPDLAAQNCSQIRALSSKYKDVLTAQSFHISNGCAYLQTLAARDELLNTSFVDKGIEAQVNAFEVKNRKLMLRYAENAKVSNREWVAEALVDAADIQASFARKLEIFIQEFAHGKVKEAQAKAIDFYRKALDQAQGNLSLAAAQRALQALREKDTRNLALNRPEALWPAAAVDPRLIGWEAPSESVQKETEEWSDLKSALDSGDWPTAEKIASDLYSKTKQPTWAAIAARALAEQGAFSKVRAILANAVEQNRLNHDVATSFLLFSGDENLTGRALHSLNGVEEEKSSVLASLAQAYKNRGESKKSFEWSRKAIARNTGYAPTYGILADLFNKTGFTELAQKTLDIGIRNTQGDAALQLKRGYFMLSQRLPDQALSLADNIIDVDPSNPQAYGLKAFALLSKEKKDEALKVMAEAVSDPQLHTEILPDAFAINMAAKDSAKADSMVNEMEKLTSESARANYLLGVYYHSMKRDPVKARAYLTRAQELGLSFIWLEIAMRGLDDPNRLPSSEDEGEGIIP